MKEFSDQKTESLNILRFFIRHFKILGIATVASMVIAAVVTLFIPKEYLSYGTIFPTSANSLDITLDNPSFGYDVEADRLIQILESNDMQELIIKKYDLISYYDLDTNDADWRDDLRKKYFRDITYSRTIAMSVVISARTQSPQMSADIVNTIIDNINPLREKVIKKNFENAYLAFQKEYFDKKIEIDTLTEKIAQMRDSIKDPRMVLLMNQQNNLSVLDNKEYQNSTQLEVIINEYLFQQFLLNEIGKKYYKAKMAWERAIPSVYVLDRAVVSHKKVYPSMTLNMIIAGIGALLLSWIVIFLIEKIRELKKEMPS